MSESEHYSDSFEKEEDFNHLKNLGDSSFNDTKSENISTDKLRVPLDDSASTQIKSPRDMRRKCKDIFATLDRNGDGSVSRAEFIKAIREHKSVQDFFQLPDRVRQE